MFHVKHFCVSQSLLSARRAHRNRAKLCRYRANLSRKRRLICRYPLRHTPVQLRFTPVLSAVRTAVARKATVGLRQIKKATLWKRGSLCCMDCCFGIKPFLHIRYSVIYYLRYLPIPHRPRRNGGGRALLMLTTLRYLQMDCNVPYPRTRGYSRQRGKQ